MVEGIILAAGSSQRAETFKPELLLGEKTLLEQALSGMSNVCSRIIVVGGYKVERVREILKNYSSAEVLENTNWQSGMFSSVKVGVKQVKGERFFLLPADVPLVPESVYCKLLEVQGDIIIPVFGERKGHPVLFQRAVVADILSEPDDSNLRQVIRRRGFVAVSTEHQEVLMDVDTPEDYDGIQKRLHNSNSFEKKKGI
jgi:molybdenum cofactor cytidylyltransferase